MIPFNVTHSGVWHYLCRSGRRSGTEIGAIGATSPCFGMFSTVAAWVSVIGAGLWGRSVR